MCAKRNGSRWTAMLAAVLALGAISIGICSLRADENKATKPQPSATAPYSAAASTTKTEAAPDGAELFAREWLPHDARAHGGDGLGPVFNDSSCVACHNQGGSGGAGPASKNADIITAFPMGGQAQFATFGEPQTLPQGLFDLAFGSLAPRPQSASHPNGVRQIPITPEQAKAAKEKLKKELTKIHPGFGNSRSVVLHHFGTDPNYEAWRNKIATGQFDQAPAPQFVVPQPGEQVSTNFLTVAPATQAPIAPPPATAETAVGAQEAPVSVPSAILDTSALIQSRTGVLESNPEIAALQNDVRTKHAALFNNTSQEGTIQVSHTQRNPIALFGIGQIDAIPERAIIDLAKTEHEKYADVAGRPAREKDGRIGRFGWKDQKPSLEDFALTACAVELGLNVPGHEQAGLPLDPKYKAPGLDMNKAECDALVSYLRNLPPPVERKPATAQEAGRIKAGHALFTSVGCAQCHVEKVGNTAGLYSDLLLHDMGAELGDEGDYDIFTPDAPEEEQDVTFQTPAPVPMTTQTTVTILPNGHRDTITEQRPANSTFVKAKPIIGALRQEWRTAPLWGVRDSGPYLHDGRADTLEQAIAFHGGQGSKAALNFFKLKPEERADLITFLKSLTAPEPSPKTVRLAAQ